MIVDIAPQTTRLCLMPVDPIVLEAFRVGASTPELRRATTQRDWMDGSRERFAYRCLPLVIANGLGWELLCPHRFSARWNGGVQPGDIEVHVDDGVDCGFVQSHFGEGVLT